MSHREKTKRRPSLKDKFVSLFSEESLLNLNSKVDSILEQYQQRTARSHSTARNAD